MTYTATLLTATFSALLASIVTTFGDGIIWAGLVVGGMSAIVGGGYGGYQAVTRLMRVQAGTVIDNVVSERLTDIEHDVEDTSAWWTQAFADFRRELNDDILEQLKPLYGQLFPNGGSSLRDRADHIAAMLEESTAIAASERRDLQAHDLLVDQEIAEIRQSLARLETGETPPDDD